MPYCTFINPGYQQTKHLLYVAEYLEAVERGDIKRLIITFPPQHGKSELVSGNFPSWCLGRNNDKNIILSSYSAKLATTFSAQNRDTISDNPRWDMVFPGVTLSTSMRGREKWALAGQRESLLASGVGGSVTGFGGWLIIIDDPIKDYAESISQSTQDSIWNWFLTTAGTRQTPDARIIIVMTRWVENDLVGRILETKEGETYKVIHLPAISYGVMSDLVRDYPDPKSREREIQRIPKTAFPDPLGREKGSPLWPEKYGLEFLKKQAVIMGNDFEALYQGNPGNPDGNKFRRDSFRSITNLTLKALKLEVLARYRSYDLAWSDSSKADRTVGIRATLYKVSIPKNFKEKIDIPPIIIVLEDLQKWRAEWDVTEEKIVNIAISDTEKYKILVEAVASQNIGVKSLKKNYALYKHLIKGITVNRSKDVRTLYPIKVLTRGMIFILYPTATTPPEWEKEFLEELAVFPNGKHDDQIDAFTQLVNFSQPLIDAIVNKTNVKALIEKENKIPAVFRDFSSPHRYLRDKLGWV